MSFYQLKVFQRHTYTSLFVWNDISDTTYKKVSIYCKKSKKSGFNDRDKMQLWWKTIAAIKTATIKKHKQSL